MGGTRRRRVEPTDEWEQLKLLCRWPEQLAYEEIRPTVLFGSSVRDRAEETGSSERTLYRKAARFDREGIDSLFDSAGAKRRELPPVVRRMIVELKAEYPGFSLGEMATICYVRIGKHTIERVLSEEPVPLRMLRRFERYHGIPEPKERRRAVVALHAEGWTVKAIAGYMGINRDTVYETLRRWAEQGEAGLEDKKRGQKGGVRKAGLKEYAAVRRIQENPALARIGIHLGARTVGRMLAVNRRVYGLEKPKGPAKEKREMPFRAERRHQFWSADVRYLDVVDEGLVGSKAYAVTVLDNYSRAVVASAVSPTQDLAAFRAPPGRRAARPARGAGHRFGVGVPRKPGVCGLRNPRDREAWVEEYNAQYHSAHEKRTDGKRSPAEVLGVLREARLLPQDLDRTFFAERFVRVLDAFGYGVWQRWRVYGEEGLAGREAALWLRERTLTVEHSGEPLSRFAVEFSVGTKKPRAVGRPVRERDAALPAQALPARKPRRRRLEDYAPRRLRPESLQQALFPYHEAWG